MTWWRLARGGVRSKRADRRPVDMHSTPLDGKRRALPPLERRWPSWRTCEYADQTDPEHRRNTGPT
jgi:hypothetical protein